VLLRRNFRMKRLRLPLTICNIQVPNGFSYSTVSPYKIAPTCQSGYFTLQYTQTPAICAADYTHNSTAGEVAASTRRTAERC